MNIDSLTPGQTLWDKGHKDSVKGLHLRALASKKTFYLYYRTQNGTQRKPKIGDYPTVSLEAAREIARAMILEVLKGGDPSMDRQAARAELTILELFNHTWDKHWNKPRFIQSGWAKEARRYFEKHIAPMFGASKVSDIKGYQVRLWHNSLGEKSIYNANRSLEVFSKMFSFAEQQEWRPQNTNPCRIVDSHTERKRKRVATPEEIKRVGQILLREAPKHQAQVAFLFLLMFSGSRPRAIERAKRIQLRKVNHKGQLFGLLSFDGKTTSDSGEEETVVIPPQAMALIDSIPVPFDGTITGIKMPRKFWTRVKKEAGCPDLWARDWRRAFASVGLSMGLDVGVIGSLLNHRSTQTTKLYAKLMYNEKMTAASAIADTIEEVIQPKVLITTGR